MLLRYQGKFLGLLGVAYDIEADRTTFADDEIELLEGFAELISAGVSNYHYHRMLLKQLIECENKRKR